MTPNQFGILDAKLDKIADSMDQRFRAVDKKFNTIDQRFNHVDQRFDAVEENFKTLNTKIDGVKEDLEIFASDIHDRLSSRIEFVATFVGAPKSPDRDSEDDE